MDESELSEKIIGCALKVHSGLGPGLLESAYKECLYYELRKVFDVVHKERPLPLVYEQIKLDCGYRADLLINNTYIVEVKAVESINELHVAQVLTYLRLLNARFGLLINFNVVRLRQGLRRVVNGF